MKTLLNGLKRWSLKSEIAITGKPVAATRSRQAARRSSRARLGIDCLETRDLLSGIVSTLTPSAPSVNTGSNVAAVISTSSPTSGTITPASAPEWLVNIETDSSTAVSLLWTFDGGNSGGGDTYKIYESQGGSTAHAVGTSTAPSYGDVAGYEANGLTPNTTYSFYVVDTNDGSTSPTVTATTFVAAPSIISLSDVPSDTTGQQVSLSCGTVPGATFYSVQYEGPNAGGWSSNGVTGQNSTNFTVTGLSPNTPYQFEVGATNGNNTTWSSVSATTWSSPQSITTFGAPPSFSLSAASSTQVNVSWSDGDVPGGSDFLVDQQNANGTWSNVAASSTGTSATISGLMPYTTYTYKVGVIGSWGVAWANPQNVTTAAAPLSLTANVSGPSTVNLSWGSAAGAQNYAVYEQDASTGSAWAVVGNTMSATTFPATGLASNTDYNFKVCDVGAWGVSWSNVENALTLPVAPTASATAESATQINVGWTAVSTTSYEVDENVKGAWVQTNFYPSALFPPGVISFTVSITGLSASTTYQFKVGATNASGTSWSNVQSATTLPTPPTLAATPVSASQINLSWNSVSNATDYLVYELNGSNWTEYANASTGTSYKATGLAANSDYSFKVCAVGSWGQEWSNVVSTETFPAAPSLSATPESATQINLTWNPAYVLNYEIDENVNGVWQQLQNVPIAGYSTSLMASVTGLSPDTTYQFKVGSTNASGTTWSNVVSGLTFPAAPSLIQVANSPSQIYLGWNLVAGATGYSVQIEKNGNWVPLQNLGSTAASYTATGLAANSAYNFRVGAYNASGTTWAYGATITTLVAAPTLTATVESSSSIELAWNSVAGADGYSVEVSSDGRLVLGVGVGNTQNYNLANLAPDTTYEIQVVAHSPAGYSYSNSVTATTFLAAPTLSANAVSPTQIDLSWNAVAGATDYIVEKWNSSTSSWVQLAVVSNTTYDVGGLLPGTYDFRVLAVGSPGSTSSNVATAQCRFIGSPQPLPGVVSSL